MKFKAWLRRLEETNNKNRPGEALSDKSTAWGAASHFGGERTMLPLSRRWDNRATAGVLDALGKSAAKEMERSGAEPGVASRYDSLEDIRRDIIRTANMPLQLPEDWQEGQYISISKARIAKIKSTFNKPLESTRVWRVDNTSSLIGPQEKGFVNLYTFFKDEENENKLDAAINYTTAMIQASFAAELSPWAHLLNLDRPDIRDRQFMIFPLKERDGNLDKQNPYGPGEKPGFYKVMMCALVFRSKKNAPDVGDNLNHRGNTNLKQNQNQNKNQTQQGNAPSNLPGTSQSVVSANPTGSNPNHSTSTVTT